MTRRGNIALALIASSCLVAGAGCTRTSDGSVVMKTPAMPGLFARATTRQSFGPDQRAVALAEFPPATQVSSPPRRGRVVPPIGTWTVQPVKAPFERSDPEKPLNCRNEASAQGRVKVTCL